MPHQCTGCGHTFEDGSKEMLSGCPECGGNKFQFRPAGADSLDDASGPHDSPEPPDSDIASPSDDDPADPPDPDSSSVAETVGRATTRVRDFVSSDSAPGPADDPDPNAAWPSESEAGATDASTADSTPSPSPANPYPSSGGSEDSDDDIIDADARRTEHEDSSEDPAQTDARGGVASREEVESSACDVERANDSTTGEAIPGGEAPGAAGGRVVSEPSEEEPDIDELREQLNDQFESIKIVEPGQYELNLMELYDREEYIIALQENGRYVIQVPEQWIGDEPGER